MKVRAKHWLKHNGLWHHGGEEFEVEDAELRELRGMVEIAETSGITAEPERTEPERVEPEQPKRRGRKPKAEAAQ